MSRRHRDGCTCMACRPHPHNKVGPQLPTKRALAMAESDVKARGTLPGPTSSAPRPAPRPITDAERTRVLPVANVVLL